MKGGILMYFWFSIFLFLAFHSTGVGQQREIHQGIQQAMHQSGNIQQSLAQQTPQPRRYMFYL